MRQPTATGVKEMKPEQLIERGKREIIEDMKSGVLPTTVSTFEELHDYVDANEYAGLCEPEIFNEVFHTDIPNIVQDALHKWLTERTI